MLEKALQLDCVLASLDWLMTACSALSPAMEAYFVSSTKWTARANAIIEPRTITEMDLMDTARLLLLDLLDIYLSSSIHSWAAWLQGSFIFLQVFIYTFVRDSSWLWKCGHQYIKITL
jgi:hypothetical protein